MALDIYRRLSPVITKVPEKKPVKQNGHAIIWGGIKSLGEGKALGCQTYLAKFPQGLAAIVYLQLPLQMFWGHA